MIEQSTFFMQLMAAVMAIGESWNLFFVSDQIRYFWQSLKSRVY